MRYSVFAVVCAFAGGNLLFPAQAAADDKISIKEVAPPYPSRHPPLNEAKVARPGEIIYRERATGLPAARLAEPLTLKNTPAGRVTIGTDYKLHKHLVGGEPYYCATYAMRVRKRKRRKAGFYICLGDGDGDEQTLERVRIITLILTILSRERSRGSVKATMRRSFEDSAHGTLSPKKFVETTAYPDDGDYFEAVIKLTEIKEGVAEFRSELRDKEGRREFRSDPVRVPLPDSFPQTVTVPHPFEGDMVYQIGAAASAEDKEKAAKIQERAARVQILSVDGQAVKYKVVRSFKPWRYWVRKEGAGWQKKLRWRRRPEEKTLPDFEVPGGLPRGHP